MKPYFIGIGAQKSGTSWIFANLSSHPEINMPVKEIHFFSRSRFKDKGVGWYESHFKEKNKKNGEFSTSYLYDEASASRIYNFYPDVKIIAVLRNPVDRAYSNYLNDIMAGEISNKVGFFEALKEHPEYVEQGVYVEQIRRYLKYYTQNNIKIMIYEDIKTDPKKFMKKIYEFLKVDTNFVSPDLYQRINPSYVPRNQMFAKFKKKVLEFIKKTLNYNFIKLLKKTKLNELINKRNIKETNNCELYKNDKKKLHKIFQNSIINLEVLINRDLTIWRTKYYE